MSESKNKGLAYFAWYADAWEIVERRLNNAELGELCRAVMRYAFTSEKMEREQFEHLRAIEWPLDDCYARVDRARKAYEAQVQGGAKGGKAKARNAAASEPQASKGAPTPKQAPEFIPPTKTEFRDIVKHLRTNDEIDADNCEVDDFYEELCQNDWTIGDRPITSRGDVKSIVLYRFDTVPYFGNRTIAWNCFRSIFAKTGLAGEFEEFADHYDEQSETWVIDGKTYTNAREAVEAYFNPLPEDEEALAMLPKPP